MTAWRHRAGVVGGLSAALVVLAVPSLASGAWTAPVTLSPAGQDADEPDVAVDDQGDAVFAWERSDGTNVRIQTRARSASGTLSPVQTLSPSGMDATEPDVAVDSDGDAVVAWELAGGANIRVQSRARLRNGTLGQTQTLSPAGVDSTRIRAAMDSDGDAVFAWQTSGGAVQSRTRARTGALGVVQTLSAPGTTAFSPDVAIRPTGGAVFVWTRFSGVDFTQRIQLRTRTAGGALGAIETLSPAAGAASRPHVDVDPMGDAVAVWQRPVAGNVRAEARARSSLGALGPVQTLSAGGQNASAAEVGVAASGDAVMAWERSDGSNLRVQARGRSAAGALSPVQTPSPTGRDAGDAELGVDKNGAAVFVWERTGTGPGINAQIQARTRMPGGALGATFNLSPLGPDASEPRVEVNPGGEAVAAWVQVVGASERIQASAGP